MPPDEFDAILATLGWSDWELSRRLGCSRSLPGKWRNQRTQMPVPVAEWLRSCGEALRALPPPSGWKRTGQDGTSHERLESRHDNATVTIR